MNLKTLLKAFSDNACSKVYVKKLSANDNSKNQVYFGGNYEVLNILPIKEIVPDSDEKGGGKKTRFKTRFDFFWLNDEGALHAAPDAQLILYPKYPEVRFSGFLNRCKNAPSELMVDRLPERLLFLGVSSNGSVIGYVVHPNSDVAKEYNTLKIDDTVGVFSVITISSNGLEIDGKRKLIQELKRIHSLGWINSRRLKSDHSFTPCTASQCGGYTLEAELGIVPNGYSEPDYLGWEVKQFSVSDFSKFGSQAVTLMTPEPTNGFYVDEGVEKFISTYGYPDKRGREARINFGGVHKFGSKTKATNLELVLEGYNRESGKVEDASGFLGLIDIAGNVAASWSFSSLLKHWNTKHANACYVPAKRRKIEDDIYTQQYAYGNRILMGSKTDFSLFLREVSLGNVYYDPGIKLELAIEGVRKQQTKRRSQFRIKASQLTNLYRENEVISL